MAVKERSFWSTTTGFVTGLAGVLTAVVGLVTVAAQVGWLGSDDGGEGTPAGNPTQSTAPGGGQSSGPAGTTGTTSRGLTGGNTATTAASLTPLSASPATVTDFDTLAKRERLVTIRNSGSSSIPLRPPAIEGIDASQFTTSGVTCGSRLDANRTCEVKITYQGTRTGQHSAKLVIQPADSTPALEVPLAGSRVL